MSFFERLLSLKWYFYVFTLGTVYAILSLIIMFPTILNPYRLPTTILLLFILSSGVITFPWIQLAWHGRFGHFTMWWLKSFGKAYVKRNRDAKEHMRIHPVELKDMLSIILLLLELNIMNIMMILQKKRHEIEKKIS